VGWDALELGMSVTFLRTERVGQELSTDETRPNAGFPIAPTHPIPNGLGDVALT
jgi:hypothetical protein